MSVARSKVMFTFEFKLNDQLCCSLATFRETQVHLDVWQWTLSRYILVLRPICSESTRYPCILYRLSLSHLRNKSDCYLRICGDVVAPFLMHSLKRVLVRLDMSLVRMFKWVESEVGLRWRNFSFPPSRADRLKSVYRVGKTWCQLRSDWAWSERVNLYSRQLMVLPNKTKTHMQHSRVPVMCTGLPPRLLPS